MRTRMKRMEEEMHAFVEFVQKEVVARSEKGRGAGETALVSSTAAPDCAYAAGKVKRRGSGFGAKGEPFQSDCSTDPANQPVILSPVLQDEEPPHFALLVVRSAHKLRDNAGVLRSEVRELRMTRSIGFGSKQWPTQTDCFTDPTNQPVILSPPFRAKNPRISF